MDTVKTEIVESKEYKNKLYVYGFAILYIASAIYIFQFRDNYPNVYLSITSYAIYLYGLFFILQGSLLKPKTIGSFVATEESLSFKYPDNIQNHLNLSAIKTLKLLYTGYGSWSQYIWGNKNYLEIESNDGNNFKFEFRIKNKKQKTKLKNIFQSQPIKEQFKLEYLKNSRHRF